MSSINQNPKIQDTHCIDVKEHDTKSFLNNAYEGTNCQEHNNDCLDIQPSKGFASALLNVINNDDLDKISVIQSEVSENLRTMVSKCQSFNEFSQTKHQELFKKFEQHTQVTKELQQDLENVFRRIRTLKAKVMTQYPSQFATVKKNLPDIVVEDD